MEQYKYIFSNKIKKEHLKNYLNIYLLKQMILLKKIKKNNLYLGVSFFSEKGVIKIENIN
jgi:hypothetical protein